MSEYRLECDGGDSETGPENEDKSIWYCHIMQAIPFSWKTERLGKDRIPEDEDRYGSRIVERWGANIPMPNAASRFFSLRSRRLQGQTTRLQIVSSAYV